MNAEKLFLNLGYTKHITENEIKYWHQKYGYCIRFDLKEKTISKYELAFVGDYDNEEEFSIDITVLEFLAINRQMEELDWFKQISPLDCLNLG
jgi:hypothetical protein